MVFHRNENPEWKQYQLRGVALGISLLNHELENEQGVEKRKELEAKIAEFKKLPTSDN